MAADQEKDLEPVENVIVSGSHELCRCLRLSQPQLLCFSPPPLPGRQSDGFKRVRNLNHSTRSGVTYSKRHFILGMALYRLNKLVKAFTHAFQVQISYQEVV